MERSSSLWRRKWQLLNLSFNTFFNFFKLSILKIATFSAPIVSEEAQIDVKPRSMLADCKLILISISSAAILFCLVTTAAAAIAIGSRRKVLVSPSREEELKLKQKIECCKRRKWFSYCEIPFLRMYIQWQNLVYLF